MLQEDLYKEFRMIDKNAIRRMTRTYAENQARPAFGGANRKQSIREAKMR